jgi:hypothetical protein
LREKLSRYGEFGAPLSVDSLLVGRSRVTLPLSEARTPREWDGWMAWIA